MLGHKSIQALTPRFPGENPMKIFANSYKLVSLRVVAPRPLDNDKLLERWSFGWGYRWKFIALWRDFLRGRFTNNLSHAYPTILGHLIQTSPGIWSRYVSGLVFNDSSGFSYENGDIMPMNHFSAIWITLVRTHGMCSGMSRFGRWLAKEIAILVSSWGLAQKNLINLGSIFAWFQPNAPLNIAESLPKNTPRDEEEVVGQVDVVLWTPPMGSFLSKSYWPQVVGKFRRVHVGPP